MALTKKQENIIKRWVKALRSGEYKQGNSKLHYIPKYKPRERFCCLGVLCDLAVKAKVIPKPVLGDNNIFFYNHNSEVLPTEVMKWAGLKDDTGDYDDGSLARINDDGKKFETIAKLIESKPDGLFV